MHIIRRKSFDKSIAKLDKKIIMKVIDSLEVFQKNPLDPQLHNHSLKWKIAWFRSLNVTGDYRIIIRELSNNSYEIVELIDVGTHSQLYG